MPISDKMLLELGKATWRSRAITACEPSSSRALEPRAFCTGADISAWSGMDAVDFARHWISRRAFQFDRLAQLSVPLIAAINGSAFGGGLKWPRCATCGSAAPDAIFALPEAAIGVTPGWSGSATARAACRKALLREMALTGGRLNAERHASEVRSSSMKSPPIRWRGR